MTKQPPQSTAGSRTECLCIHEIRTSDDLSDSKSQVSCVGVCKINLVSQSQTRVAKDMDRAQLLYVMSCTLHMLIICCND